jgi:hypothetical protein
MTDDAKEIKKIMRPYWILIYQNLDILVEMEKFLETCHLWWMNNEDIKKLTEI